MRKRAFTFYGENTLSIIAKMQDMSDLLHMIDPANYFPHLLS